MIIALQYFTIDSVVNFVSILITFYTKLNCSTWKVFQRGKKIVNKLWILSREIVVSNW